MPLGPDENGVTTVFLTGALAAFGSAGDASGKLASSELAGRAAGWFAARLGRQVPVLYADQRHTYLTFVFGREGELAPGPSLVGICDAIVTGETDVALQVQTADCLPVALAGGGAIAMVHAGWRGLAADILAASLGRLRTDLGIAAAELEAVIGVGIGPCHYLVGPEVVAALARRDAGGARWRAGDAVDLGAFAAGRLETLGVAPERITRLPGCTACTPGFHSYRRDGAAAGRQWSAIVRLAKGDGR
jgi:polyphenol oxidase